MSRLWNVLCRYGVGVWFGAFGFFVALSAGAQGPTIAQIKFDSRQESLWAFLAKLPASFEAQMFYGVLIGGLVGMLVNYGIKWMRGEIQGSLIAYLFFHNVRGTMLSFVSAVGTGIAGITMGVFTTSNGEFTGWFNLMWIAVSNGFFWDAAANKGARPEWTAQERAIRTAGDGK